LFLDGPSDVVEVVFRDQANLLTPLKCWKPAQWRAHVE
jgi:hypothetical protein